MEFYLYLLLMYKVPRIFQVETSHTFTSTSNAVKPHQATNEKEGKTVWHSQSLRLLVMELMENFKWVRLAVIVYAALFW